MKLFFYIVLLIPMISKAEINLEVVQNNDGINYYLVAKDCKELNEELINFKILQKNYSPSTIRLSKFECIENHYTVNISSYLPENIKNLLETKPEYYGPNCWNSVFFANSLSKSVRFFTDNEFQKSLNYFQCKKKNKNEKIVPGDIIRTLDKNGDDIHSFIFISNNFSFTKNGPETKFPYEIKNTNNILYYYGIEQHCLDNQRISNDCQDQVQAYDCHSLKSNPTNEGSSKNGLEKMIEEAEIRMTILILNYRHFPNLNSRLAFVYDLRQKITSLYFILNNDLTNGKLDPATFKKEDFYMSKVLSLMTQLNYF